MYYIRLCEGLNTRGILIPATDNIYSHIKNLNTDWYSSVYFYNEEQYKKYRENGSVKGIRDVVTNKLVFDFDSKDNLELAKSDALKLISKLAEFAEEGLSEDNFEIHYSGNKGFNVTLYLNRYITPEQARILAVNKLGKGLETLDTTLYDAVQIIRIPYTTHQVSKLHKIPLSYDQLFNLSITDIQKFAGAVYKPAVPNKTAAALDDNFYKLPELEKPKLVESKYKLDMSNKPYTWKNCRWALLNGFFEATQRHEALMVLAATCRGLGYDKTLTYYTCKSAIKKQAERTGQTEFNKKELYSNILESIYDDSWDGGMYSCKTEGSFLQKYCQSLGRDACRADEKDEKLVLDASDLLGTFDSFVKNFDKNRIKTGIPMLDRNVVLTIGQPVGVLAAPGVAKTTMALNILNYNSNQKVHSLFFSLDMFNALLAQKLLQKFTKMDFDKLKHLVLHNPSEAVKYYKLFEEELSYMKTVAKSGMTVEGMKKIILDYQKENNLKVRLIVVDYLELLSGPFGDETSNSAFNARALRDLSVDLECCVIVLLQPQKTAEPDQPITSYRKIKGASILEQSFRIILAMHRPAFGWKNPEEDRYLGINVVKNTMGPMSNFHLYFNGQTGEIRDLLAHEQDHLRDLVYRIEQEKASKAQQLAQDWGHS
jgi:hypothetical protein